MAVLQEAQAGATIEELCRRHGISAATFLHKRASVASALNDSFGLQITEGSRSSGS